MKRKEHFAMIFIFDKYETPTTPAVISVVVVVVESNLHSHSIRLTIKCI